MACDRQRKLIPLAAGHDLTAAEFREFDEHLRSCLSCYREYRDYQDVLALLDPLRAPESPAAPDGLVEEIMAEVRCGRAGAHAPHAGSLRARCARLFPGALPIAAALVLFCGAGLLYFASRGGNERLPRIPAGFGEPAIRVVHDAAPLSPADEFGGILVIPERMRPGKLHHLGPAPFFETESLPPARLRQVSDRDDF
ncbi:MAG: hypothetical protein HY812_02950 [Planctomycetes bacterium]|nr:hypothetical protein [Planctomycetota bacterium]